jgi:fatty-acyl-CoA synthase
MEPLPTPAHWPPGVPREIPTPDRSIWQNLVDTAARVPDRVAQIFLGTAITWRRFHDLAERLAGHLHGAGVGRGDRVILLGQNSPQFSIAFFAILRADAVVVPVNPMNKADELGHYITDSGARFAIAATEILPALLAASDALPDADRLVETVAFRYVDMIDAADQPEIPPAWREWMEAPVPRRADVTDWTAALASPPLAAAPRNGRDDLAVLPYTSGTTGLPKGCMHTHGTLLHNIVAMSLWTRIEDDAVVLAVVPMFHATGLLIALNNVVHTGVTAVVMPRWDRRLAADAIARWKVTHWTNIPTMVIDLMAMPGIEDVDLSSLRYIGGGGAAMPAALAERLEQQFGLRYCEGYGLTETAAPSHSNPRERPKRGCLGIPFIGVASYVADPATLEPVPQGEQGEIVISGPQVFKGYWKQPVATDAVFFARDGRRWFRSGDLGTIDPDGYFFITDRLKRMINSSGFKVWPAEIEQLMYRHPAIQEVCVIGSRDAYRGETVKAVVVLRPEAVGKVDARQIVDWSREHMAAYKHPREVEFVESLPRSGSGKLLWRVVQERENARQR